MGKIPTELRETIAKNIRDCRMKKFPGRGGGKKCAESFGVSPQQWSPWERGMRTPDELRLSQIAKFFGVTVEYLRRDHSEKPYEVGSNDDRHSTSYYRSGVAVLPGLLSESEAPSYGGLPSLRRDERPEAPDKVAELAAVSSRILGMVGSIVRGATEKEYDIGSAISVLRHFGHLLNRTMNDVEGGRNTTAIHQLPEL